MSPRLQQILLVVVVLSFAALAATRTIQTFDLGWQLAAGRHIVESRSVPRQDVFSHTAAGREWIYPAGGQVLLYVVWRVGGYAALNLLAVLVCILTVACLLLAQPSRERWPTQRKALAGNRPAPCAGLGQRAAPGPADPAPLPYGRGSVVLLAMLAVPAIAARSAPRADMFSTLFCAAVLVLLVRGVTNPAVFLAVFALWANLHQGFIFGLALFVPFVFEALLSRNMARVRRLALTASASAAAILLNPFGWRLYASLWRVSEDMTFQRGYVAEASGVPLGWWRLRELARLHDPDTSFWILACLAAVATIAAITRRQIAAALLLAGALYLGLRFARAQALLAIVTAVLVPMVFAGLRLVTPKSTRVIARTGVAVIAVAIAASHGYGFVSNRHYVSSGDLSHFGTGISWFFPERALEFIARERLPQNVYNDYNLGGWTMWRLWPDFRVYIDGRAAPFTPEVFVEQQRLIASSPKGREWQDALDRRGVRTLLISLARFGGYRVSPAALCAADEFRLVYMDEVSGVWLRNLPENRAWIERLARPCPSEPLPPRGNSRIERYNFLANAGTLYAALGRDADAMNTWREAERLFPDDPHLRISIAHVWRRYGRFEDARREFLRSLALRPTSAAWHALGLLEFEQRRFSPAAQAFGRAAGRAVLPHESYRMLGESLLAMNQPARAIDAFERARATARYRGHTAELGRDFMAAVEQGRLRAERMLGR